MGSRVMATAKVYILHGNLETDSGLQPCRALFRALDYVHGCKNNLVEPSRVWGGRIGL